MRKKWFLITALVILMLICSSSCSNSKIKDWHLKYLSVENLWSYSKGSSQTIAFIDTGISPAAESLYQNRIVKPYNIINNNNDVTDNNGHGTKMVSIACGNDDQNNSYEVYGVAPKCKIMPIKAIADIGKLENDILVKAIDYAINNEATIINLSVGGHITDNSVTTEINKAINKGITVVAAAGDYGNKDLLFPANIKGVISVEAKDQKGGIWKNSNISPNSIIAMPGENIKELKPFKDTLMTNNESGTSQSTAITSGYVALLRDYYINHHVKFDNSYILTVLKKLKSIQNINVNYTQPFKK